MELYEEAVLSFITRDKMTFAIPQFSIDEWSCPDFVAICPPKKKCYVVEVSAGYDLKHLSEKIRDKDRQWIDKLRSQLEGSGVTDASWSYEVLVFVRIDRVEWLRRAVEGIPGVEVLDIEKTLTPWNWPSGNKP